jgi:hypothetical protein
MEWSKEMPTEPGVYWCYDGQIGVMVVVEFAGHIRFTFPGEEVHYLSDAPQLKGYLWQGPIEEPAPPQGADNA